MDEYLLEEYKPSMSADELYDSYTFFEEDPFIMPTPDGVSRFLA